MKIGKPTFLPTNAVLAHVSSSPPSSPVVGARWCRTNGSNALSLDGWDWTWDGTRWLGPPVTAGMQEWWLSWDFSKQLVIDPVFDIVVSKMFANIYINQTTGPLQTGTISLGFYNGATNSSSTVATLSINTSRRGMNAGFSSTPNATVDLNGSAHSYLALGFTMEAITGDYMLLAGINFRRIWS